MTRRSNATAALLRVLPLRSVCPGTEYVVGVAGSRAELPCHLLTEQLEDRAILALWYIQGQRLPVYSYDARGVNGLHQPDDVLAGRGSFDTSSRPARLILSPVLATDQGVYTCRVDFISSPTHNTVVNLTVIEPPEKLAIYDSRGTLVSKTIGPINEGSPLSLSCIVTGGRPQPTASWWSGRNLVEKKSEVTPKGHIKSELRITEVTRAYHQRKFFCQAQNNNQQKPLVQEVTLDMNLRPLSVRIKIPEDPLIAGRQYSFTCESQGSKPSASITWFQDAEQIDAMRTLTRSSPGEITVGEVTLVPSQEDDRKTLKCQASNPSMPGSAISDSIVLNVHYAPLVTLEMGKSLNPDSIKQGDDVYFECRVDANPQPYRVTWEKNREEVKHNQTAGVILSGNSLVLQQVERSSAGEYMCSATNTQGTQLSNPVRLDIMYPPECMVDQPTVLAVGRGERVNISCRVASNPPRATFNWRLNGSDKTYTSPGERLPWGHLASHYTFLGATDKDYGALFCWANNSIGKQETPCVFQIIPAGPPSSPENCEIINNTAENIEVMCEHGFDGGMEQAFLAEVYDEEGALHLNQSSGEPQFSVESLQPGTTYTIRISAYNDKGRSQPISLTAVTLKVAEQRVGENKSLLYSPLIIIFLSIVGVFLTLIVILVSVTRWRKNNLVNNASSSQSSAANPNPTNLPLEPLRSEDPDLKPCPTKEEVDVPKVKQKKKVVVVVENGTKDSLDDMDEGEASSVDVTSSKDALLGRHGNSQHLANGSAGYYDSLGKTSFPSHFPSASSSATLPRSHRASSSSSSSALHQHAPSTSANESSQNSNNSYHFNTRYSETLPRKLSRGPDTYRGGGILRVGGSNDSYRNVGDSSGGGGHGSEPYGNYRSVDPYSSGGSTLRVAFEDTYRENDNETPVRDVYRGMGRGQGFGGSAVDLSYHDRGSTYHGVGGMEDHIPGGRGGDKYQLLEELKNNPKYVVRTRTCEPNDESFV
ncbi:protein turtle-like isoform X2 [Macrobrachium rosenbergii]|uniref:protein turtle-like isoform X2 n=1 Tax=Macrobrachium rosenbergii TaxID=79674 RepID=UPI0034D46D22